jgi:hypothetical protein
MSYQQRAILSLIAAGRITALEAERLIAAWEDEREWLWIVVACIGACLLQMHPHINFHALGGLLNTVAGHGANLIHTAATHGLKKIGGIL